VNYLKFAEVTSPTLLLEVGNAKTQVFVVSDKGVEIARTVAFGISSMIPLVQKELALKDEESAKKLFFSNSFDFTGMGPQLTKRLLRELQASIGFYEVQTGQSIGQLCCTMLPSKVTWLQHTLAEVLGMSVVDFHHASWLESMGIGLSPEAQGVELGPMWSSLLFLLGDYEGQNDEAAA
jgi:Tfp pilus assembly PilM family ATPase